MLLFYFLKYTGYMKHVYFIGGVGVGFVSSMAYYYYLKNSNKQSQDKSIETELLEMDEVEELNVEEDKS